jgi:hypothetical protein
MHAERCFFADRGPCDGQPVRAHLIPRQLLKREFPHGVILDGEHWRRLDRGEDRYDLQHRSLQQLVDDPRSWVPMCGGPTGIGGHHGQFDGLTLRILRGQLPAPFVEFCAEVDLSWYIDRQYGEARRAA